MKILTVSLFVVACGTCVAPVRATAASFSVEYLDETTTALIPGRLVRTPSGALLATGGILPGSPSWYVEGTPYVSFIRERSASGWIPRASKPPIDIGFGHDLAIDGSGWLHTLSWQYPCSDYSRPVLQDEGPSGWSTTVLDTGVTTGVAIRLDAQGDVWTAYLRAQRYNCCWGAPFDLVVAHRGPAGWERDSIAVESAQPLTPYPFAVDGSGRPHVLYLGAPKGLWYAVRDGAGWQYSIVDTALVNGTPQIETAWDGTPHVLWAVGSTLWHARLDGASWVRTLLPAGLWGSSYDLALAQNGSPRASFVEASHRLGYAQDLGAGWTASVLGEAYTYPTNDITLVLDGNDRPAISFRAGGSGVGIASTPGTADVFPSSPVVRLTLALASANPSRGGGVTWSIQLPEAGEVTLEAFDVSGRKLATSAAQACAPGESRLEWDPAPRRAGTFFVRARVNGTVSNAVRWHAER